MQNFSFGIDLGTTNSCIAVMSKNSIPKAIRLTSGKTTLPSCVMYKDGKVIVGDEAYKHREDTAHVIYSSKRAIGTDYTYDVYAASEDAVVKITPTEVASEILKTLKHEAELQYGIIDNVTITVPAYFGYPQRLETKKAAELAGFKSVVLINEPTSAALAYTYGTDKSDRILVYDLGGGTFDVTILEMTSSDIDVPEIDGLDFDDKTARVISSTGNDHLGGDDIDISVLTLALAENAKGITVKELTRESYEQAILMIENIKKQGTFDTSKIVAETASGKVGVILKEKHFKEAYHIWYLKTKELLDACISEGGTNVSKIILVGGSTKSKFLRQEIMQDYNYPIYIDLNPDEAVALGAAIHSSVTQGDTSMCVVDVLPHSIGISYCQTMGDSILDDRFFKIIKRNEPLPAKSTYMFSNMTDNPKELRIKVYQGEDSLCANNMHVGTIEVPCSAPASSGDIDVPVTLMIDANGLLSAETVVQGNRIAATLKNVLNPDKTLKKADKIIVGYETRIKSIQDEDKRKEAQLMLEQVKENKMTKGQFNKYLQQALAPMYEKHVAGITNSFSMDIAVHSNISTDEDE